MSLNSELVECAATNRDKILFPLIKLILFKEQVFRAFLDISLDEMLDNK